MRTLVIGLDAACLSVLDPVLDPMVEDGLLPNIATLQSKSAVAPLESQLPPWTPSAWPSLYTGVNPGKHGVYDFLRFEGYDWDVVNRSHVKEFAVWELLSDAGYSSVVVNVPVTGPPREFDGALVPGYTAPEAPDCHPKGVWDDLVDEIGEYKLYNVSMGQGASEQERKRGYGELTRMRGAAFRHLVGEYDPDFGFVQFQQTDTVFHDFPGDREIVRRVYSDVDAEIGEILETCDPDITLLVSDHGIGPMAGYEFRVNDYLHDRGYLTTTATGGGMPSWKSISRKRLRDGEYSGDVDRSAGEKALEYLARIGITSQRIGTVVERLGLEEVVLRVVPSDLIRAGTEQVDFPSSVAYMRARTELGIRLNLDGREPEGTVREDEYDSVRDELIAVLERVETPDGDPVFERVCGREEVFDGPYLEDAPDIITVPNEFEHFLVANLKGEHFGEPTEPWEHKLDGVMMVSGDEIDTQRSLGSPHLFDVTPTILATFGLPVAERMDGETVAVVDPTEREEYPRFEPGEAVRLDDGDVERRLSDLGYLG